MTIATEIAGGWGATAYLFLGCVGLATGNSVDARLALSLGLASAGK